MARADTFTLYGTEFSLYTGKARAYLRYKGIPYREVLSTVGVYRKIIVPRTGVRFIPVLATPEGEFVQDTTEIIDVLEARFPERTVFPPGPRQAVVAKLLELYGDEWLLIQAMHYRWSFPEQNEDFIMAEFGRVVLPWAPAFLRRKVARSKASLFAGMLPILGIDDTTAPAIEDWYLETLDHLDAHFARHRYVFGDRASIADFGLIAPLYAHLYRDPAPGAIMRQRAPHVVAWVERMFQNRPEVGDWLPEDEVPETLLPLLQRQFSEQFPVLRETVAAVARWVDEHPGERLPRRLGRHSFRIGSVQGSRELMPYPQWMLQRALDVYQGLPDDQRAAVDQLLSRCGGQDAMQMRIPRRVERVANRLVPGAANP
ncbi:MAG: glutathione S-transferase family protein [Marinobacter sp.]|uniref:glutathione S-transferase family protein n=1 Tax=Marinobacter sp. TaxID=50741 RepID=UPI00299E14C9|nr:glutathione S-transferase family protein [Marinobacter sp.]MDX1634259.1 glutathione S-transferase family protein [Marinobacter sp.]